MRCRLFGHRLYADPEWGDFCVCRCGRVFAWVGYWDEMPKEITYPVD